MSVLADGVPRAVRAVRAVLADAAPHGVPGLRRVVQQGLVRTLEAERPAPDGGGHPALAGDPGLTGPGSASWQVMDDVAGLLAGVRALLLQTLHPLAIAGVADHSTYADDPFGRLHRTGAWVGAVTFGALDEVLAANRVVRGLHRRVRGTAPDGRPYAADDPELLAWVSMTFTDSLLAADHLFAAHPVDRATADRFVLEQSRLAALLDPRVDLAPFTHDGAARAALRRWDIALPLLDDGLLPHDVASLEERLQALRPRLARTQQARDTQAFLRDPGLLLAARPAYGVLHRGAVASLPGDLRALVGHPTLRGHRAALARARAGALLTALRLGTGGSPARRAAERRVMARPSAA